MARLRAIAGLLVAIFWAEPALAQTPVTLRQSYAGRYDYVVIGGSLRTQPNTVDACAVTTGPVTATLPTLPAGSTIVAAWLYWAGSHNGTPDYQVTLNGTTVTAGASDQFTATFNNGGTLLPFFGARADVTSLVSTAITSYAFSNLTVHTGSPHCGAGAVVSGFSLVVIYNESASPTSRIRVINLFDGFQLFQQTLPPLTLSPQNYLVDSTPDGKLAHVTFEGDPSLSGGGEDFTFQSESAPSPTDMTNANNPAGNQFNSTITRSLPPNGTLVPTPPPHHGVDIDVYDIASVLYPGDTQATTVYTSGQDLVILSAEVMSVANSPVADLGIVKGDAGATFTVGSTGAYTFTVNNAGPNIESGPITVTDVLPAGLTYASFSGTGWSVNASGAPTIVFTHNGPLAVGASLPVLTMNVNVGEAASPSVSNTATVDGALFDNISANDNDTEPTPVVAPDLSTSTKSVVDLNGGEANPGDVLRYTITLLETANVTATNVVVTDNIPALVTGFTVVSIPAGATNASTGSGTGANGTGYLNITGITVPASGSRTIVFDVTISGSASPGNTIDNTANVNNPNGPDATPVAPTITVSPSDVPTVQVKPLYLSDGTLFQLHRTPPAAVAATAINSGASATWTMTPASAASITLEAGVHNVNVYFERGATSGSARSARADLYFNGTLIGQNTQNFSISAGQEVLVTFPVNIGASARTLATGGQIRLVLANLSSSGRTLYVQPVANDGVTRSRVVLNTATVIRVDAVTFYDGAYPGGTLQTQFDAGEPVYVRAVVSDPFGSFDIPDNQTRVTITDPGGTPRVTSQLMTRVADSGAATKTFQYLYTPLPAGPPYGNWVVVVNAIEGTELNVSDNGTGQFLQPVPQPNFVITKTSQVTEDPTSGGSNPKRIPGSFILYTIQVTNQGLGAADLNTLVITDHIPDDAELYIGDLGGTPAGSPVTFQDGAVPSGITLDFVSLSSGADDLEFSNTAAPPAPPYSYTYSPTDPGNGFDDAVTSLRITPSGQMNASNGVNHPSFTLSFRVRVR